LIVRSTARAAQSPRVLAGARRGTPERGRRSHR
jgi:hypothetical protein